MTLLGSAPHHERVLAVVLVVENPYHKGDVPYHVLKPNSPEWESFWQDIGRPEEGPKRTSEAPATDECVQRACPTGAMGCQRKPPRTHRIETYQPKRTTDAEIRSAVRGAMGDPEPACPTHARPLLHHPRRGVYECPECVFAIPADERGAIREDHVPFARALTPDQPITYTATKTHAIPLREPVATLGDLEKAEAALADVLKRATPWLRRQHKPYSEEA